MEMLKVIWRERLEDQARAVDSAGHACYLPFSLSSSSLIFPVKQKSLSWYTCVLAFGLV